MKAKDIIARILRDNYTEQQGLCVSGFFETTEEFAERWFASPGFIVNVKAGGIQPNRHYLYSYNEQLSDSTPDVIIETMGDTIYLYEVD